jgi:hypothetical protein
MNNAPVREQMRGIGTLIDASIKAHSRGEMASGTYRRLMYALCLTAEVFIRDALSNTSEEERAYIAIWTRADQEAHSR